MKFHLSIDLYVKDRTLSGRLQERKKKEKSIWVIPKSGRGRYGKSQFILAEHECSTNWGDCKRNKSNQIIKSNTSNQVKLNVGF